MYRRNDPRLRRTLNDISQTIESANETAQTSVFVFGKQYISPCLHGIYASIQPCVQSCFPSNDQRRRSRARSRGRPELNFDFYDDWEEDENADLLGWDEEDYDGFVAGAAPYGATSQQPGRQRAMSYGARRDAKGRHLDGDRDGAQGPGPSYFNFIGKIKDKLGPHKGLRYMPSAAGLQDHPGSSRHYAKQDGDATTTDESDGESVRRTRRHRKRSGTVGSEQTTSSLSSRGDLFPSEDEDDAVPLDDEFAMVLERRTTSSGQDDGASSGLVRSGKRPGTGSRRSTQTMSSKSTPRRKRLSRTASAETSTDMVSVEEDAALVPTLAELKQEEERVRMEEEEAIRHRREAAQLLAAERGLAVNAPEASELNKEDSPNDLDATVVSERLPAVDSPQEVNKHPADSPAADGHDPHAEP